MSDIHSDFARLLSKPTLRRMTVDELSHHLAHARQDLGLARVARAELAQARASKTPLRVLSDGFDDVEEEALDVEQRAVERRIDVLQQAIEKLEDAHAESVARDTVEARRQQLKKAQAMMGTAFDRRHEQAEALRRLAKEIEETEILLEAAARAAARATPADIELEGDDATEIWGATPALFMAFKTTATDLCRAADLLDHGLKDHRAFVNLPLDQLRIRASEIAGYTVTTMRH